MGWFIPNDLVPQGRTYNERLWLAELAEDPMDYPIAQTNLQLFRQMMDTGRGLDDLMVANRAYLFAAGLTGGVLRGSGKPFACHLVGTASVVVACGMGGSCIAAALLHAAYQNRVPFPGTTALEHRREYLRRHFGEDTESLVYSYHQFESAEIERFTDTRLLECRTVVVLRLADEIDDLIDDGLCIHGQPGDDASVMGGAAARCERAARRVPEFVRISRVIGAPVLERHFTRWQERCVLADWPAKLRTGAYSSFTPAVAAT
jgi:hypothetical protein